MDKLKNSIEIKLKANKKYSFCTCGKNNSLPYCDNKHRTFNEKRDMNYKSMKIFSKEDSTILVSSSTWRNIDK